jgi:hypothetical protein
MANGKKTIFTLNIGSYEPAITQLTYPFIQNYADKIGADFHIITERKFPQWPVTYEKLQIYELGREMGNDWNIYIDSDALIHPDLFDITEHLPKDTVLHNGNDLVGNRWKVDDYFRRDGRWISSCDWFTVASSWNLDLWKPLDDLTMEQAIANIRPINIEKAAGITADHLIDDYTLSRNIAKYGLKFKNLITLLRELGQPDFNYLYHQYTIGSVEKLIQICGVIDTWGITSILPAAQQMIVKTNVANLNIKKVNEK